jgi:low temperature requirement protein LtrA
MFISAMIFLSLSLGFTGPMGFHTTDGWYVLMGVEATTILLISGHISRHIPFLNFSKTDIIDRLGTLTLIILGEGVMGLAEAVVKINEADGVFSSDAIGLITSGVLIIYFIYMLYFDQIETKGWKVGSICQQLWTLGHFPFHVCILLVVAGVSQFIIWRRIMDYLNQTVNLIIAVNQPTTNTTSAWEDYAHALNTSLMTLVNEIPFDFKVTDFTDPLTAIAQSDGNPNTLTIQTYNILSIIGVILVDGFQVGIPEIFSPSYDINDVFDDIFALFSTVFLYFFISSGLALVLLACLYMLGTKYKTRVEYISISIRVFIGVGLTLLTVMYAPAFDNSNAFSNYFSSAWMTPTVVLAYALGKSKNHLYFDRR